MIAIVAPEPARWIARLAALASAVDEVEVIAPWALPGAAPLRAAAGRVPFVRRRLAPAAPPARIAALPGFALGELALAAWIGRRTDRRLRAMFWRRAAVDRVAAAVLSRRRDLRAVIAPSGAAERTFAAAAAAGARRILLEDLPGLRQLHRDLDRAAAAHPQCRFLRRFRAAPDDIARQEVEWALADALLVRSRFARETRVQAGVDPDAIVDWPADAPAAAAEGTPDRAGARAGAPATALAAGLAVARHGTVELLALLDARPDLHLAVLPGEGLEPAGLLDHPRVSPATAAHRGLDGVDLVLAPSWVESNPVEVALAAARGVPVIATSRAAGFVDLAARGAEIEPGDVRSLAAAVEIALAFAPGAAGTAAAPAVDPRAAERALVARLGRSGWPDAGAAPASIA